MLIKPPKPNVVLMPTRTKSVLAFSMSKRNKLLPMLTTSRKLSNTLVMPDCTGLGVTFW